MTNKLTSKLVIGLMSGTSVDGIDACLAKINPDFSFEILESLVLDYPENIKKSIFNIFENKSSIEELCWLNFVIGEYFAKAANELIKKAGISSQYIDLIGSHGQTVFHRPSDEYINEYSKKSTLQIGEPSIIAERTGIVTIADFRPADIAAGGQGAPLVCYADELLFKSDTLSRAIQNIGGMANVTVLSPQGTTFAFDTGPGNVIIDYCAKKFFKQDCDNEGKLASQGEIDENWLNILLHEEYYLQTPPKTTGRELFSAAYIEKILKNAPENPYNIMATVTALTAKTIYNAYKDFIFPSTAIDEIILGGGGAYNSQLVKLLKKYFGESQKIKTHKSFGISDKYKEALAFAFLAYTTFFGIPNNVPNCTGAKHKKVLGKICYP
jgi:anhydro-N-acetylmuramic acid kinase